jgi:predicted AAA+ superfamily ATPase
MASLANSLDVSGHTVRHHIDLLEGAFMARRLPPLHVNMSKRLVKSPKLYLRDTGVLHTLLDIHTWEDLLGHPALGASWEALCIESILGHCKRNVQASFYRTTRGAEIDLVLEAGGERVAIEFKASTSPRPRAGFWVAVDDLQTTRNWIIAPVDDPFPLRSATVTSLSGFLSEESNRDLFER